MLFRSGGGLDVQLGHLAGIRDIVAVDVNRALPALLAQSREYHGGVYERAGAILRVAEGRQFLRQQRAPFDVIYLALTQTASADDPALVAMVHPDVAKTLELLDSAGGMPPMRLRPGVQAAELMWTQQFKGEAVNLSGMTETGRQPSAVPSRKVQTSIR